MTSSNRSDDHSLTVGEGLFDPGATPGVAPTLLGSRCEQCGESVFPRMRDCPRCMSFETMRNVALRGEGVVHDFIVTQRGPTGFAVPYIQAYVRLVDGPLIYSMLDGFQTTDGGVSVGDEVEMIIAPLRMQDGEPVTGWKFRPRRAVP
jgi:uncharacterized OB-fold protein